MAIIAAITTFAPQDLAKQFKNLPFSIAISKPVTEVLQAATKNDGEIKGNISFNLPAVFNAPVTINSSASVSGNLTAPNILYGITAGQNIAVSGDPQNPTISTTGVSSFQGQTGAVALTAGSGISISGLTISSTGGNSFENIKVGSSTITAGSSTDTLEFVAGSNISLSVDTSNKKLTITNSSTGTSLSGLTTNGVLYADSSTTAVSLTPGTSGYILQSNGTGSPPSWVLNSSSNPAFSSITSGTNSVAAMVVGSGASLTYSGGTATSGVINANQLLGSTWAAPGAIGGTTPSTASFTALTASGAITFSSLLTNGGLLYTNGSGVVTQTGAGSTTTILHGGTTPSYSAVSLTTDVTGTLPIGNGGTNITTYATGDMLYASAANTLSKLTIGSTGQVLSISGGAPVWVPSSSVGLWQINAGAVIPSEITNDLLLGATSTASAKFAFKNVAGGTPTASISANSGANALFITGAGNLATTNDETLTLGGTTTGNIILDSGVGVVQLADLTTNGVVYTSGGNGTLNSEAQLNVARGGTGVNGSSASNGQLLIGNGSGFTLATLTEGSGITINNSAGGITIAQTGAGASKWTQDSTNGTLYPKISTLDLLVGGISSSSAKFAVLNVNSGTPTASLSAGLAGGAYLTADGTLQTTANQRLTLGGSSTGDIFISPRSASGTLALNVGSLTVNGNTGSTTVSPTCVSVTNGIVTGTGACGTGSGGSVWTLNSTNGTLYPINSTLDTFIGGVSTASAKFGFLNVSGGTPTASISAGTAGATYLTADGQLQTTAKQSLIFGGGNTGNIVLSGFSTGLIHSNASGVLSSSAVNLAGSSSEITGILPIANGGSPFEQLNGAIIERLTTQDLLLGSTATSSSKFAFINVGSGTPTASISANSGNIATTLTGTGILGTTNAQTLTLGNSSTGEVILAPGGTTALTARGANLIASGTLTGLTGLTSSGTITFSSLNTNGGVLFTNGSGIVTQVANASTNMVLHGGASPSFSLVDLANDTTGILPTSKGGSFWNSSSGALYPGNSTLDLLIGGVSSTSARFHAYGSPAFAGTTPSASISGQTSFASLVVDNSGTGDIFTASSSGLNRFVITQNGNVGIGTTLPTANLSITQNNVLTGGFALTGAGSNSISDATLFRIINNDTTVGLQYSEVLRQTKILGGNGTLHTPAAFIQTNGTDRAALTIAGSSDSQTADLLQVYSSNANGDYTQSTGIKFKINPSGTIATASVSGTTSFAALLVDNSGAGDLFTASKSGAPKFTILNNGNISWAGESNFQNVLVTSATAARTYTFPDASGTLCLQLSSSCGFALGTNFWQSVNAGTITPYITTVDTLFGGVSTSSATLRIAGSVNAGTQPAASISANSTFAGLVVDNRGSGDLITASSSGLTRFTIKQNGNLEMGSNNSFFFDGSAHNTFATFNSSTTTLSLQGAGSIQTVSPNFFVKDFGGTAYLSGDGTNNRVGINTGAATTLASLDIRPSILTGGTLAIASISGKTSFAGLLVDNTGAGDLFSASKSGAPKFTILNNGNISWAGESNFQNILNTSATAARTYTFPDASGTVCLSGQTCSSTGVVGYWQRNSGALAPAFLTDDLLIGGVASSSATFHVFGAAAFQGTNPVASIAANTSFAGLVVDNKGVGDLFTASSSGKNRFVITQIGNVGIGTTLPSALFHINQPFSNTTAFLISAATATFGDPHLLTIKDETATERIGYDNLIRQTTIGGGIKGIWDSAALVAWTDDATATALRIGGAASSAQTGNLFEVYSTFNNTNGTKSDLKFAINPSGTISTASVSAKTSFAAMVVDNSGSGDLFTASSSGLNRFVIKQNGNVGIGVATPSAQLFVGGSTNPATIGTYIDTGIVYNPNSVAVRGRYAYVVGTDSGNHTQLKILDVTDPTRPASVGATPIFNKSGALANTTKRIFVAGNYAYTVNQGGGTTGFQITDITNASAPLLVNSSTDIPSAASPQDVVVRGRYAYIAGNGNDTLYVVDIANPQVPVTAGSISTVAVNTNAHNPNRVVVIGDYAYVTNANSGNSLLQVFDISTPSAPTYVGKVATLGNARSIAASGFGKYLFVTTDSEMETIDIGNPAAPTIAGTGNFNLASNSGSGAIESVLAGRDLYILSPGNDVMQIWDVSVPTTPVKISGDISLGTGSSPVAIALQGRYAFIAANGTQKLLSVNIDGAYLQQLEAGAIETNGGLTVGGMFQGVDGYMTGGLTVGNGLDITGGSRFFGGASILDSQSATAAAEIWNTAANTGGATGSCSSGCHTGLIIKLGASGSTTAPGAPDRFIDFMNGAGTVVGKIRGNNTTTGVSYDTTGGDFAEYFKKADASEDIPYGSLVCTAPNGITKCNSTNTNILGVASDVAGFTGRTEHENDSSYILVGLVGQVPTYLSTENGTIHAGDNLTWSSTPGYAAKATKAGFIIGRALENFDGTESAKRIWTSVQPTWYDPDVFITDTGNVNIFENNSNNNSTFTVKDESGHNITRVGLFAKAVVGDLKSGNIDVQKLTLAGQDINSRLSGMEQTASQAATLTTDLSNLQSKVLGLSDKVASQASTLQLLQTLTGFTASSGAELGLDKLIANDVTVGNTLNVLGRTTLSDLGVTGNITAGTLTIRGLDEAGQASINSIGNLKLQDLGTGGLDILNGKVIVDTAGNVNIKETLTAKVVKTTKLDIIDDTTSTTSATLSASAGSVIISAGDTSIDVDTTALTANSLIFVTPDQPILIGAKKKDADTFTIKLQTPAAQNIKINWWLIN